mmetsp:Transcript_139485/g.338872  ORF Transcript_139485/g.338872 Transcript_139485/m.338872 type:complete len:219 (-) Transcript_139485:7-663(-)
MGLVAHRALPAAGVWPRRVRVHQQGHVLRLLLGRQDRGRLWQLHVPVLAFLCDIVLLADSALQRHACGHCAGPRDLDAAELHLCAGPAEQTRQESQERVAEPGGRSGPRAGSVSRPGGRERPERRRGRRLDAAAGDAWACARAVHVHVAKLMCLYLPPWMTGVRFDRPVSLHRCCQVLGHSLFAPPGSCIQRPLQGVSVQPPAWAGVWAEASAPDLRS